MVQVAYQTNLLPDAEVTHLVTAQTEPAPPFRGVTVTKRGGRELLVDTGRARFIVPTDSLRLLSRVQLAEGTVVLDSPACLTVDGRARPGSQVTSEVTLEGGVVAEIQLRGQLQANLRATAVLRFVRNETAARISLRIENVAPCPANDQGQPSCADVGSPGSWQAADLSWGFIPAFPSLGLARFDGAEGPQEEPFETEVVLLQGSNGTSRWDALRGQGLRLQAAVAQREAVLRRDGTDLVGPNQSTGWLDVGGQRPRVTIGVVEFWQNFPKSLRHTANGRVEVGLFPGEYASTHRLRAGEYKSHDFFVHFHQSEPSVLRAALPDLLTPLHGFASAEWYARTFAAGPLGPRMTQAVANYEAYIDCQLRFCEGYNGQANQALAPTVHAALERYDLYGYLDYGDLPTDFETGTAPYNLAHDVLRGFFFHHLATGDERWWNLAQAGARHFADIDILHSRKRGPERSRHWFEGGAWGRGHRHEDGQTNPHRNYANPNPKWSSPGPGLALAYLMTGDPLLRDSFLELAENAFWRLRNSVHHESCSRRLPSQGDTSRCGEAPWGHDGSAANYVNIFLWAHRLTGDQRYLEIIEQGVAYQDCMEGRGEGPVMMDQLGLQTFLFRAIGEYQLYRRSLGLDDDRRAQSVLRRRWEQFSSLPVFHHRPPARPYLVFAVDGRAHEERSIWLVAAADVLAYAALLEEDWGKLDQAALPLARAGSHDPSHRDDQHHYHGAQTFSLAVGAGHVLRYALWRRSNVTTNP
jgi:hypothetical protein